MRSKTIYITKEEFSKLKVGDTLASVDKKLNLLGIIIKVHNEKPKAMIRYELNNLNDKGGMLSASCPEGWKVVKHVNSLYNRMKQLKAYQ